MPSSVFRCSDVLTTMLFEAAQAGAVPCFCAAPELSWGAFYTGTLASKLEYGPGAAEHLQTLLIQSGEKESVRPLFPELEQICDKLLRQLADGVFPFADEDAAEETPAELISRALVCRLLFQTAILAQYLENQAAYQKWIQQYNHLRENFLHRYYQENRITVSTQSAMTLALFCGIAPEDPGFWALLVDQLLHALEKTHRLRITTGSMGTPALLPVLCEAEALDPAWQTLRQTQKPNWNSEIVAGASKLWERSDLPGAKLHYPGTVAAFLMREAAGIRFENTFRQFKITPRFGRFLNFVHAELPVKTGVIVSEWERTQNGFELRFSIPAETQASVYGKIYTTGSHQINIPQTVL